MADDNKNARLILALRKRELKKVEQLLSEKINLNGQNKHGMTPLMMAIDSEIPKYIDFFISKGVDLDIQEPDGDTALMMAVTLADHRTIKNLVDAGADTNIQNNDGNTALFEMVESAGSFEIDFLEIIDHLKQSDMELRNNKCETILLHAIKENKHKIVDRLFTWGNPRTNIHDKHGNTPLMMAIRHGNLNTVKILVEKGDAKINDLDDFGIRPLILASWEGNLDIIKFLITKGADVNVSGKYTNIFAGITCGDVYDFLMTLKGPLSLVHIILNLIEKESVPRKGLPDVLFVR